MFNKKNYDKAKAWLDYIDKDSFFQENIKRVIAEQSILEKSDYETIIQIFREALADKMKRGMTSVILLPMRTEECLKQHKDLKPIVWNFADFLSVGGWFLRGSMAQEESLCHVSGLYRVQEAIFFKYYAKHKGHEDDGAFYHTMVYHPGLPYEINGVKFVADTLSVAAPRYVNYLRYHKSDTKLKEKLDTAYKERFELAYLLGALQNDTVIGGAWGCGAFKGDQVLCANLWYEMSRKYPGIYQNVILPIPPGKNYDTFKAILSSKGVIR